MRDDRGYYRVLGVSPDASASQIAAAYKRLAKELHPDRNAAPTAKQDFQRISEAYQVLGDPQRRAQYDTGQQDERNREDAAPIEPIVCSRCKAVVAQPRYIVFRHVVSAILVTLRTPVQGIYCAKCARREAFTASLVSALAGWWGFPWGPIYTIAEIIRNASGGERPAGAEQRLLWVNALAFYRRGDLKLSYGLARRTQSLGATEIGKLAASLREHLEAAGVPASTPALRNPWKSGFGSALPHLGLLCALPALFVAAAAFAPRATASQALAAAPVVSSGAEPTAVSQISADATAASGAAPQGQPACATPPANGQVLAGDAPSASPGHRLEVRNGADGPAIVKVRDAATGALSFSFYVAQGDAATIGGIPDGAYRIQYAVGQGFLADCVRLAGVQSLDEFPSVENFSATYAGGEVETETLSYTLYPVPGGNVRPTPINADAFDAS